MHAENQPARSELAPGSGSRTPGVLMKLASRLRARTVRAVAGTSAALAKTRRGSFLVLVVGTLALMSVFAIVYVAIGRADTGTSAGLRRNLVRDDVPEQLAEYINRIIGDDVLSTFLEPTTTGNSSEILIRREGTDYPYTPWAMTSSATGNQTGKIPFDPTGSVLPSGNGAGPVNNAIRNVALDAAWPSDPWLASTVPTYLNYNGDPYTPTQGHLLLRDWAQISNVAPDGAFVNLANLRFTGVGDERNGVSGFAATPAEMRKDLSLLNVAGNGTTSPSTRTSFGLDIGGIYDRPATWTMLQKGAFRPANVRGRSLIPVGDPRFALNQWADADGDGFLDSRWFELVDARNPRQPKNYLETSGKLRYFFAARIVDLSSLVNAATATDASVEPADSAPLGSRPTDVDLRRLLSLEDLGELTGNLSYGDFPQPLDKNGQPINDNGTIAEHYVKYTAAEARGIGRNGYASMYELLNGNPIGVRGRSRVPAVNNTAGQIDNSPFGQANWRQEYFDELAGTTKDVDAVSNNQYIVGTLFTPTEMLDLFAFRGQNNPEIVSNLERFFDGRYLSTTAADRTERFGPMRSNRSLELERRNDVENMPNAADPAAMLKAFGDVRQYLTMLSGARQLRSPVIARSTDADAVRDAAVQKLAASELKTPITSDANALFRAYAGAIVPYAAEKDAWPNTSAADHDKVKTLNYGHTTAELGVVMSAHLAANMAAALGSQAPAYTVLLDEEQRSGGIDLNADWADTNWSVGKPIAGRGADTRWAWWVDNARLDLGTNVKNQSKAQRDASPLGDSAASDVVSLGPTGTAANKGRGAINVYPIRPEPVITAVANYYLYADVDDQEKSTDSGAKLDIKGNFDPANKDFIVQVLAVQLSNPFDKPITLFGGTVPGQNDRFDYYFEFAGRYFRIAKLVGTGTNLSPEVITLNAGESRVFYALNQSKQDVNNRLRDAIGAPPAAGALDAWLNGQFGVDNGSANTDAVWVRPLNPKNGGPGRNEAFANLVKFPDGPVSNDENIRRSESTVRLWKALRTVPGDASQSWSSSESVDPSNPRGPLPPQFVENDQLVDRFVIPNIAQFDAKMNDGKNEVDGTEPDTYPDPLNNSLAITSAVVLHRQFDTKDFNDGPAGLKGTAPGYMISSKFITNGPARNYNQSKKTAGNLRESQFSASSQGDTTVTGLLTKQATTPIFDAGEEWITVAAGDWGTRSGVGLRQIQRNLSVPKKGYDDLRTELVSGLKTSTIRTGDLLLPLAVGAQFVPFTIVPDAAAFDEQYTTLGEALAIALDYDVVPAGSVYEPLYKDFGHETTTINPKTDRGHLVLDEFLPFYDDNANGVFDAATDRRRGHGVPLALGIFDSMTAWRSGYVKLDRAVPGQINLNTAPPMVLRTMPLLAPNAEVTAWFPAATSTGATAWEIAPTIAAFRDKSYIEYARNPGQNINCLDTITGIDKLNLLDGRFGNLTDLAGIREQPGLMSIGDVLTYDFGGAPERTVFPLADEKDLSVPEGVRSTQDEIKSAGSSFYGNSLIVPNAISNIASVRSDYFVVWFVVHGYARTDTYKTVTGSLDPVPLDATEPMVPSVQRRFVMVVDRSQVVQKGQKPRVVLFREVPL